MSLRSLLARGVDRTFRGVLNSMYIIDDMGRQVRLRSGAVDAAVERTLQLVRGLSRYDPGILRNVIAPLVRESLNAARRLNAGMPTTGRQVPWAPGDPQRQPGTYSYLVRAREVASDGTGRSQQLTVVRSPTALSPQEIHDRAAAQIADQLNVIRSPKAADRLSPSSLLEFSTITAYRESQ